MKSPAPTVAAMVREQTGASWSRARKLCAEGRVTVDGRRCLDPAARVSRDAVVAIDEQGPRLDRGPLGKGAIVFADRDLVVVDKPAGMLSVADEPGNKDTLAHHVRTLLRRVDRGSADAPMGVVHRLDRGTSGVMVFARTAAAQRHLAAQFRAHGVERVYEAIVHGEARAARIETQLVLDRGDGLRGSFGHFRRPKGAPPADARLAITQVTPIAALDGATLVECRLQTGRQHQVRIHLAERGNPLVGEDVYIRDYHGRRIAAPRPMLHARVLGFVHPRTNRPVRFERGAPADFRGLLQGLRGER